MRILKGWLTCLITCSLCTASFAGDTKVIYMALWRGVTDAEQGFMDYLNAQNIDIEFVIANAESDKSNVVKFPADIRQAQPDLVYTFGTTVTLTVAGKQTEANGTDNIVDTPIVFNIVADPVGANLVQSMNQASGRNITGASHLVPIQTQLNAIQELGAFKHIGVLYNASETNSQLQVDNLQRVIDEQELAIELSAYAIDSEADAQFSIGHAVRKARTDNVDVLYLPSDSFLIENAQYIALSASAQKLPVFSATDGPVKNGHALAGLVSKYYLVGQFAGFKALQILQGTNVATIPIETLTKFNTVVNLDVADQVDYYPPVNLLLNATLYRE